MNILICDDILTEAELLSAMIVGSGFEVNTIVFDNAGDALNCIRSDTVIDVCFLDIIMPDMSGIALAEALRSDGFKGEIVFLSTSRDYGPEAFGVKAFNYLLKPPTPESVRNVLCALDEARRYADTGGILVKTTDESRFVLFRDISHVEVIRNNVYYRLKDSSELETRTRFAEVATQLLTDNRFIQCHRSYIVNMNAVTIMRGSDLIMQNGAIVPISRSYPEAKEQYIKYVLGGSGK